MAAIQSEISYPRIRADERGQSKEQTTQLI
jgi:hypothetical protein